MADYYTQFATEIVASSKEEFDDLVELLEQARSLTKIITGYVYLPDDYSELFEVEGYAIPDDEEVAPEDAEVVRQFLAHKHMPLFREAWSGGFERDDYLSSLNVSKYPEDLSLVLYSEEWFSAFFDLSKLLHIFFKSRNSDTKVCGTWASTCSKARPGAFSGGGFYADKTLFDVIDAHSAINLLIEKRYKEETT